MDESSEDLRLYHIGGGVPSDNLFFGRENELRKLRNGLPSNFLVLGGRMQGKTSFLKAVHRRSASWGWDSYYIHASADGLVDWLAEIWSQRESRRGEITPPLSARPPVLLIDEAEELVGMDQNQRKEVFRLLSSLSTRTDSQRCCFVLAGGWSLLCASQEKPFDNFGRTIRIGALSLNAAKLLLRRLEKIEISYEHSKVSELIAQDLGQQAYLLCLLCNELAESVDSRNFNDRVIRENDVIKAVRSFELREKMKGWQDSIKRLLGYDWTKGFVEQSMKSEAPLNLKSLLEGGMQFTSKSEDVHRLLTLLEFDGLLLSTGRDEFRYLPLFRREVQRLTHSQPLPTIPPETTQVSAGDQRKITQGRRFRVALSFPGQHRDFVQQVADILAQELGKSRVFYDYYHQHELARPNLDTYLQNIYHNQSDLIIIFISSDYETREWCGLEWRAIRDLIKKRRDEDLMPVRMDDGDISGLFSIDGYIPAGKHNPRSLAELILKRLG